MGTCRACVNTLRYEGAEGVRRAYPSHKLARLAAVKYAYDPDNAFHLNQNILPRRPEHEHTQDH
jgi:Berberine and berberine like